MKNITINEMSILCHTVGVNVHDLPKEAPTFFNQNRYCSGDTPELKHLLNTGLMTASKKHDHLDGDRYWRLTQEGKSLVKQFISAKKTRRA